MNANEIADHMEKYFDSEPYCDEVATMLRQLQAENEALKSVVYWLKENRPEVWEDIKKWSKL